MSAIEVHDMESVTNDIKNNNKAMKGRNQLMDYLECYKVNEINIFWSRKAERIHCNQTKVKYEPKEIF